MEAMEYKYGLCHTYIPPPTCASTLQVRKRTIRRGPVLRQGSAQKRTPKRAVRKKTVRRAPVLRQGSACARGGGGACLLFLQTPCSL